MQEEMNTIHKISSTVIEFFVTYSFQVLGAIIILIVGSTVAGWLANTTLKVTQKKKLDIALSKFLASVIKFTILGFAIIIALSKFGITIAPFIAAISAAAFGASFAIQGPLANYGAGLSIILSRPFLVGDTISVAGVHGVVEDVKLACTILVDGDGNRITIPNKHIVGEIISNSQESIVIEGKVGVSYNADPAKAVQAIQEILDSSSDVVKKPKALVGIESFGNCPLFRSS